jgi:hypothetical protein
VVGRQRLSYGGLVTPAWILHTLAAVMLVVAAVSAARLAAARHWQGSGYGASGSWLMVKLAVAVVPAGPWSRMNWSATWPIIHSPWP